MKFLITMNMPSAKGFLVHQITGDYPAESVEEFCKALNDNPFIVVDQYYKDDNTADGEIDWTFMGSIIINTDHIGKVHEHNERKSYGRPHGNSRNSRENIEGSGIPVRGRRSVF